MPEDERSPTATHLSPAAWSALLTEGDITVEGRMPWSSNVTLLVTVDDGTRAARAIYKPASGERRLRDFPGGLYVREVAAYELSELLGLGIVPETVIRAEAPYGEGSLQRFIDADFNEHYFTLLEHERHREALRVIAGFDLLANNADRKGGHLLLDQEERIYGIDNGLCFHVYPKLRTVMWDFAGERLPEAIRAACAVVATNRPGRLAELLHPSEWSALAARAERLIEDPRYPDPSEDYRSYPWPLV